jgi:hypothetical protein
VWFAVVGAAAIVAVPLGATAAGCSASPSGGPNGASPEGGAGTAEGGVTGDGGGGGAHDGGGHGDAGGSHDAGPASDGASSGDASPGDDASTEAGPTPPGKQSLIWVWMDYANSLDKVVAHASSFTQVSPALYNINYDYQGGVAHQVNGNDDYDGLSTAQVAQKVHAAGLTCIPLMYAGAGNFGTDQGIQNILNDAPAGTQQGFITSMIGEAKTKGYDGYNLDWEVTGSTGYGAYGKKLVSFLTAFKAALHKEGMTLSLDLGGWYVRQCTAGGSDGLVDLTTIGASVDWAIIEAYAGALGSPGQSCPGKSNGAINCDATFADALNAMCQVLPAPSVSIGLISTGSNSFAGDALDAVNAYGFTAVAVWPDDSTFLNDSNMQPAGATWYDVLKTYLTK